MDALQFEVREKMAPPQDVDNGWYSVFKKYDTNNDGKLSLYELRASIMSDDMACEIPEHAIDNILRLCDKNHDGCIDFQEFTRLLETEEGKHYARYIMSQYIKYTVAKRKKPSRDDPERICMEYEGEYTCTPPPVCMAIISAIEIFIFAIDLSTSKDPIFGPLAEYFIYNPFKRREIWRFFTYMFVHASVLHLLLNLSIQLMLGLPLEMVHRWWRVLIIYLTGVIAGSICTSCFDPQVYLAGASSGVYAIITAHLSTIILNWSEMQLAVWQLIGFLIFVVTDIGSAVHERYFIKTSTRRGYAAHIAGAGAGLLIGLYILRNLQLHSWEKILKWLGFIMYIVLISVGIMWNIFFL